MRGGDAWTDKQDKINRLRRERYHSDPAFKKRLLANSKRWRDKKKRERDKLPTVLHARTRERLGLPKRVGPRYRSKDTDGRVILYERTKKNLAKRRRKKNKLRDSDSIEFGPNLLENYPKKKKKKRKKKNRDRLGINRDLEMFDKYNKKKKKKKTKKVVKKYVIVKKIKPKAPKKSKPKAVTKPKRKLLSKKARYYGALPGTMPPSEAVMPPLERPTPPPRKKTTKSVAERKKEYFDKLAKKKKTVKKRNFFNNLSKIINNRA